MRLSFPLLAAALAAALPLGAARAAETAPDTYAPARPFAEALIAEPAPQRPRPTPLLRPEGGPQTLAAWRGRPTVLVFWATWCPVCREEMPGVAALARRLAARGGAVAAISVDSGADAPRRVAKHIAAEGLAPLSALVDADHALAEALALSGIPTAVFLDVEGRMRGRIVGRAPWSEPALEAYALGSDSSSGAAGGATGGSPE